MTHTTARRIDRSIDAQTLALALLALLLRALDLIGAAVQGAAPSLAGPEPVAAPAPLPSAPETPAPIDAAPAAAGASLVLTVAEPCDVLVTVADVVAAAPQRGQGERKARKATVAPLMASAARETAPALYRKVGRRYQPIDGRPAAGEQAYVRKGKRYQPLAG